MEKVKTPVARLLCDPCSDFFSRYFVRIRISIEFQIPNSQIPRRLKRNWSRDLLK